MHYRPEESDNWIRALNPLPDVPAAQADDRAIKAEGLDNLTESELREACRARGIRGNVYGEGARVFMIRQLSEWLELSLNRCCPGQLRTIMHHTDAAGSVSLSPSDRCGLYSFHQGNARSIQRQTCRIAGGSHHVLAMEAGQRPRGASGERRGSSR